MNRTDSSTLGMSASNSTFTAILNRTQQNLNKINQRYAPQAQAQGMGQFSSVGKLGVRLDDRHLPMTTGPAASTGRTVTMDESTLTDILNRLSVLESDRLDSKQISAKQALQERTNNSVEKSVDQLTFDVKDLQRTFTTLLGKVNLTQSLVESLQGDTSSKGLSKYDHWITEQEAWRHAVDSNLRSLKLRDGDVLRELGSLGNRMTSLEKELTSIRLPLSAAALTLSAPSAGTSAAPPSPADPSYQIASEVLRLQIHLEERMARDMQTMRSALGGELRHDLLGMLIEGDALDMGANKQQQGQGQGQGLSQGRDVRRELEDKVISRNK